MLWKWKHTPPSGQQMFLFVQSLFLFFVFFFSLWMGTHVNFLKVLFNVGESAASVSLTLHPLFIPLGASHLLMPLASLSPPLPPLKPSPLLELHPVLMASLSVLHPLSLGFRAQFPKAQSSFSP